MGKIFPQPLIPLHRYNSPLYFEDHCAASDCPRCPLMLNHATDAIAQPHLTANVPGERPELIQPSSSRQTTARPGATRRGCEKGDPGVWFRSWVCILACEGVRGWQRKSAAIRHSDCTRCTFRAGVPAWGACPMLSQALRAVPKLVGI